MGWTRSNRTGTSPRRGGTSPGAASTRAPSPSLDEGDVTPMNPRNRIAAVGVVAAGALLLAGCATSGSGENDSESEPQEVSTEITDEEVNLVLAYVDDRSEERRVGRECGSRCEQQH